MALSSAARSNETPSNSERVILAIALAVSISGGVAAARIPLTLLIIPATALVLFLSTASLASSLSILFVARTVSDSKLLPGSVSNVLNLVIIIAILALFGLLLFRRGNPLGRIAMSAILATAAWSLLAVVNLHHPVALAVPVLRLASVIAFAGLATAVVALEGKEAFLRRIVWLAMPSTVLLILGSIIRNPAFTSPERGAFGTFSHKNSASAYFAILGVACLYIALTRRWKVASVGFALAAVASILTVSLGGATALAVGCLFILWTPGIPVPRLARVTISVVLVASSFYVIRDTSISSRITELSTEGVYVANQGDQSNSLSWRLLNWTLLEERWRLKPILGWGFGSTETNRLVQPLGTLPHSEPVRFLVETGVLGCIGIVGLLLASIRRLNLREDGGLRLALIATVFTNSLTSNTLGYVPAMLLFVAVWQACDTREQSSVAARTSTLPSGLTGSPFK